VQGRRRRWQWAAAGIAVVATLAVVGWSTHSTQPAANAATGVSGANFVLRGWAAPKWLKVPTVAQLKHYPGNLPGYYLGNKPVNATDFKISPADVTAIRAKHWKAAFLNWSGVPYNQSFTWGIKRAFGELGIKLVATTDFEFDAVKANSQLLDVLPLNPDIIITGVLDPTQWPGILKPARAKGITIEMWSQGVQGWKLGKDYCNITSYDPAYDGATVADGIHKWFPKGAKVGVIRWNFHHPVVIGRDQGFLNELKKYPNLKVVASSWMPDPNHADTVASAMITQHPDIQVIYAPWDSPPAEGIVAAIRASGHPDIKVATMDIGNTGAHEIAHKGIIFHDTGQAVYEAGRTMAIAAAECRLGHKVPHFLIVPTFGVDRSNLDSGWRYMHGPNIPLPKQDRLPGT
jgi:ribose transport system substrate-binding protein